MCSACQWCSPSFRSAGGETSLETRSCCEPPELKKAPRRPNQRSRQHVRLYRSKYPVRRSRPRGEDYCSHGWLHTDTSAWEKTHRGLCSKWKQGRKCWDYFWQILWSEEIPHTCDGPPQNLLTFYFGDFSLDLQLYRTLKCRNSERQKYDCSS